MKYCLLLLICLSMIISCKKEKCKDCNGNRLVNGDNHPPISHAGADQTITLPINSVTLDGSGSTDPDNDITSYSWTKISGPPLYIVINANAVKTEVTNLVEGIYLFELKVTDSGGLSSKDTVQITVLLNEKESICSAGRPEINAQLVPFGTLSRAKSSLFAASAGNKIVFASGWDANVGPGSLSAEIYDLSTQSWSTTTLSSVREGAAVAVCGNKIFFAGGGYFYGDYFSDVDIYDISNNTWTRTSLSEPKIGIGTATIGNKVFFAGGCTISGDYFPNNLTYRVEIYDLSTNTWSTRMLSEARGYITAVTVNQKIYFAGGNVPYINPSNKIDIYDNATNSWSASTFSFLSTARKVIVAGDKIFWTDDGCKVEIRDVNTGISTLEYLSRSSTYSLLQPVLKDNKVVFLREGSKHFDIYNTTTNAWSVGVLSQPILPGSCAISVNNIIYIAGGVTGCTPAGNGSCTLVPTNQVWKLEF